ncbi:MAG: EAL domain-containing protein [Sphaerochaeta sp.]|nr:EAL domain-containing protein [Sphaerochaeta sp.]
MSNDTDSDKILWATKGREIQRNRAHILRMLLVGLVVFLLIVATFFFFYTQVNQLLQKQSSFYLQEITEKSAERLKEKIDGDLKMLAALALFLGGLDELDIEHWLSITQDDPLFSEFQRFGFLLPNGMIYTSEVQDVDFSFRQYFQAVMQGETIISEVFIDQVHQQSTLAYGVPIIQDGTVVGAIGVGIVIQEYEQFLELPSFAGEGTMHLLDSSGTIILKFGKAGIPTRLSLDRLRTEFKAGESGIIRLEGQGNPRLLAYAPVGVKDWMLLLEIPNTFLLKTQQQTRMYALLMTVIYGMLMLFFPYYILFRRRRYDLSLLRLAYFDEMTGIGNHTLFVESAERLLEVKGVHYACVVLNIRRFKLINDLFGYSYGDSLLRKIASMLPPVCAKDELFARKEGDRFMLFLKQERAEERVREVLAEMNQIALPDTARFKLEVVGGIFFLQKPLAIDICIDRASLALDHLKDDHSRSYMVYNEAIREQLLGESELIKDFQEALDRRQFFVLLQPKYYLDTEDVMGAEALVRWNHPTKGLLPPVQFIPVFEENNLITELDMFVLREVCSKLRQWKDEGFVPLPISVNQSRAHLENPTYVTDLVRTVEQFSLEHTLLEFEMTESFFLDNLAHFKAVVSDLRREGFAVSIDDFGSGYSSLNMLKNISFDFLKLDRGFLMEAEDDHRSQMVIQSVIQMAQKLGISIVAEGVETKAQVEMLRAMECTIAQGYYYQRPIPMDAYEKLLKRVP